MPILSGGQGNIRGTSSGEHQDEAQTRSLLSQASDTLLRKGSDPEVEDHAPSTPDQLVEGSLGKVKPTQDALKTLPGTENKASELGHELVGLALDHPARTQHVFGDVAKSVQRAAGVLGHERAQLGTAAGHGFAAANDARHVVAAAPSTVRDALTKAVQSTVDVVRFFTVPSLKSGARGTWEGAQSTTSTIQAVAKSPRYTATAAWETLRAGLDVALIPIRAPKQTFQAAWQSTQAGAGAAGLATREPRKTLSVFSALSSALRQVGSSSAGATAAARAAPGGAVGFYVVAALLLPLAILAAVAGLVVGTVTEVTGRLLDAAIVFVASCISQAARVLAARFHASPPQVLDYHKLRSASSLDLAEAPAGAPASPVLLTPPVPGLPATTAPLDPAMTSVFETDAPDGGGHVDEGEQGKQAKAGEQGRVRGEMPKKDTSPGKAEGRRSSSISAGLMGSTPLAAPNVEPDDGQAKATEAGAPPGTPHTLGADVGVRPAWEPAFEALGAVRQREQEAQDAQARSTVASPLTALKEAGARMAFWKPSSGARKRNRSTGDGTPTKDRRPTLRDQLPSHPLPRDAWRGSTGSLASSSTASEVKTVESGAAGRKSLMEKLLPARLFVKEPTPDFAAQMLHSYQREQPCANTRHGAIPTPEGPLLPAMALGQQQTPYELHGPALPPGHGQPTTPSQGLAATGPGPAAPLDSSPQPAAPPAVAPRETTALDAAPGAPAEPTSPVPPSSSSSAAAAAAAAATAAGGAGGAGDAGAAAAPEGTRVDTLVSGPGGQSVALAMQVDPRSQGVVSFVRSAGKGSSSGGQHQRQPPPQQQQQAGVPRRQATSRRGPLSLGAMGPKRRERQGFAGAPASAPGAQAQVPVMPPATTLASNPFVPPAAAPAMPLQALVGSGAVAAGDGGPHAAVPLAAGSHGSGSSSPTAQLVTGGVAAGAAGPPALQEQLRVGARVPEAAEGVAGLPSTLPGGAADSALPGGAAESALPGGAAGPVLGELGVQGQAGGVERAQGSVGGAAGDTGDEAQLRGEGRGQEKRAAGDAVGDAAGDAEGDAAREQAEGTTEESSKSLEEDQVEGALRGEREQPVGKAAAAMPAVPVQMQAAPVAEVQVAEAAWNELKWASWQLISPVWLLALSVYQVTVWSVRALGLALLSVWDSLRAVRCAPSKAYPGEPLWNRAHRLSSLLLQPAVFVAAATAGAVDTQLWRILGAWTSVRLLLLG